MNFALHGYRQSRPGAPYQRLRSRLGRFTSEVLGLDLALVQRRLRFFSGMAEVMREQRGDPPTPEERARILACDDVEQLVRWLQLPPP